MGAVLVTASLCRAFFAAPQPASFGVGAKFHLAGGVASPAFASAWRDVVRGPERLEFRRCAVPRAIWGSLSPNFLRALSAMRINQDLLPRCQHWPSVRYVGGNVWVGARQVGSDIRHEQLLHFGPVTSNSRTLL